MCSSGDGGPIAQGARAWVADVKARIGIDGHAVRLFQVDDGGDPSRSLAIVKRLVEHDHIRALYATHMPTEEAIVHTAQVSLAQPDLTVEVLAARQAVHRFRPGEGRAFVAPWREQFSCAPRLEAGRDRITSAGGLHRRLAAAAVTLPGGVV